MRGKILIVDDEPGPRESLRQILKQDHDVRTASCGEEGLREVERELPDLVFLDLRMPGMDGTEVMKRIKAAHPEVEVAIITAYAAVESARLALRLGAVDYLIKPYSVADVEKIVEKALSSRRRDHDAQVLAAQLETMTKNLVAQAGAIAGSQGNGVGEAIETLQRFQQSFGDDLASFQQLCELGEVTAEVSHDLNNLITVILTSAQFLLERVRTQEQANREDVDHWASNIVRAAQDCTSTLQQIRNYVRANINREPQDVRINDLVLAVADLTRDKVAAHAGNVELVTSLRSLPVVKGDEIAIRNVLVNLVQNSLDALAGSGRIEIQTEATQDHVWIRVKDDGPGMPEEVLANATQAFYSTKSDRGTGLGLSIAQKVARKHEGELVIESEPGRGTTVSLSIPIVAPMPAQSPAQPEPRAQGGVVVVADDQEAMRDIIVRLLETEGFRVLPAADGSDAWAIIERVLRERDGEPVMVVTDHEMPGMTGRALAERVKRTAPSVPVVLASGYNVSEEGPEDALVPKPFNISDLLDPVRRLMSEARRACGQPEPRPGQ